MVTVIAAVHGLELMAYETLPLTLHLYLLQSHACLVH